MSTGSAKKPKRAERCLPASLSPCRRTTRSLSYPRDHRALSTFFDIINGDTKADSGTLEWGTTITKAYLPNDNAPFFKNNLPLLDWLRQFVPPNVTDVDEDFLRGFFGKMLFSGDEVRKNTSVLSGGEKVRCMISRMMLQNPNCVILDEPTNHLDLESITAFNDSMTDVKGVVLFTTRMTTSLCKPWPTASSSLRPGVSSIA